MSEEEDEVVLLELDAVLECLNGGVSCHDADGGVGPVSGWVTALHVFLSRKWRGGRLCDRFCDHFWGWSSGEHGGLT